MPPRERYDGEPVVIGYANEPEAVDDLQAKKVAYENQYRKTMLQQRRRDAIEFVVAPPYAVSPSTTNDQLMEEYLARVRKVATFLDGD